MSNKLNFRLTTEKCSSLTGSTSDPDLNAELLKATEKLVTKAFAKMHLPGLIKKDRTPEVISDSTLAQIEALEAALECCRNLMIDANDEGSDMRDDWTRAIDQAAQALGYPEDEL